VGKITTVAMQPTEIDNKTIKQFKAEHSEVTCYDSIESQLQELFLIRNPRYKFDKDYASAFIAFKKEIVGEQEIEEFGKWFHFSDDNSLIHFLPEAEYLEAKTGRNKNLITNEEQEIFYNGVVGIAGLSVGSHVAKTIAMMTGAKNMRLADPDTIELSNLNRIRSDATELDQNKALVVAKYIYRLNPYAVVTTFTDGVTDDNIDEFLSDLDVLVEETDDLELKIKLRLAAKERGIPVIMATDNGDGVVLDVERYDLHQDLQLFNGVAGDLTLDMFRSFPPEQLPKLAATIAGTEFTVPRMHQSLLEVGKTLYSWPQLGSAATLSGVVVAHLVRRLLNGQPIKEGKYECNLDSIIDPNYFDSNAVKEREQIKNDFINKIGL
jgi:molybdopterin/thiamine biosynthesis adenylyltransferase